MNSIKFPNNRLLTILGLFFSLSFICLSSRAEQIRYPVPAYEGEALKKVRKWEKTWVGKRIDTANIDEIKEFVPESLYQLMKEPEKWGKSWFEIVPYREIKPTKGELRFTRKYAHTCRIGSNDELLNYVSGIAFPNPKTGLEIAYNFDKLNQGDNIHSFENILLIDAKNRYDRKTVIDARFLYFSGRREIHPVPEILPNDMGIYKAMHAGYFEPAAMRGSRLLSIKWIDQSKPYGEWSWSSTTRKLLRLSTAQRSDTKGGSDMTSDDYLGYDFVIPVMDYKYLGRKELLLARHQDIDQLARGHIEGYCLFNGIQRERINMYMVECKHKDPNYLYSKQIWYVDPETWRILYADKYDRKGELLKVFELAEYIAKSVYNNALIGAIGFLLIIDVQRLHASGGIIGITIGEIGKYYQFEYYVPKALQKYGY